MKDNHSNSDHVETDTNERWRRGIPHHPESKRIFAILAEADFKHTNDYFRWKSGGDGDNGEILMYALDVYFDLKDREGEQAMSTSKKHIYIAEVGSNSAPETDTEVIMSDVPLTEAEIEKAIDALNLGDDKYCMVVKASPKVINSSADLTAVLKKRFYIS